MSRDKKSSFFVNFDAVHGMVIIMEAFGPRWSFAKPTLPNVTSSATWIIQWVEMTAPAGATHKVASMSLPCPKIGSTQDQEVRVQRRVLHRGESTANLGVQLPGDIQLIHSHL